jgi:hypothetical protein
MDRTAVPTFTFCDLIVCAELQRNSIRKSQRTSLINSDRFEVVSCCSLPVFLHPLSDSDLVGGPGKCYVSLQRYIYLLSLKRRDLRGCKGVRSVFFSFFYCLCFFFISFLFFFIFLFLVSFFISCFFSYLFLFF